MFIETNNSQLNIFSNNFLSCIKLITVVLILFFKSFYRTTVSKNMMLFLQHPEILVKLMKTSVKCVMSTLKEKKQQKPIKLKMQNNKMKFLHVKVLKYSLPFIFLSELQLLYFICEMKQNYTQDCKLLHTFITVRNSSSKFYANMNLLIYWRKIKL